MGRATLRKVFRNSLQIQTLEKREVFAGDVNALSIVYPPRDWSPIDHYINGKSYEMPQANGELAAGMSQADFDAELKSLVGKYWEGVLGKRPQDIPSPNGREPWYAMGNEIQLVQQSTVADKASLSSTRMITNTRHASIDEADFLDMTNDGYLYTISGGSIQAVDLRDPANVSVKSIITVENSSTQLFVVRDSLILVQTLYGQLETPERWPSIYQPQTKITVYDITERMNPSAVMSTVVEGSNMAARLTNDQLTLVQSHNTTLPRPALVVDDQGVERYELLDSYYANHRQAIEEALHPVISQANAAGTPLDAVDSGSWDDLSFANESLSQQTTILRFELADDRHLVLTDTETITGLNVGLVYQGLEDIYLVGSSWWWGQNDVKSYIYKIDATAAGQLKTYDVVEIKGRINDSTWMNEHEGILQVASLDLVAAPENQQPVFREANGFGPGQFFIPTVLNSANITTIGETDEGWAILGTLEDIGDGQSLLAANFMGDKAVVTTGLPEIYDPLHGIDLSDPTNPVEMSELTIPGFTTYLKQIDETHWLGFGFEQNPGQMQSYLQVSLYRVDDLANPVVVDRWTSSAPGWGQRWDPHSISYDPATGLVIMTSSQTFVAGLTHSLPLLKVDVDAEDAITDIGNVKLPENIMRGFTLDDVFVGVGQHTITTYDVNDLTEPLDRATIANYDSISGFFWAVQAGGITEQRLIDQWAGEPFVITALETTGDVAAVLKDGSTVTLTALPSATGGSQPLTLTLQFESGHTRTVTGIVYALIAYPPAPTYSDARGSVQARFEDDDGNVVNGLAAGDEVWVTVSASDSRDFPSGVFAAYVDVSFDSQNVTVLEIEHIGPFTNGKSGDISPTGIKTLGGFGGLTPPGQAISDIARFKVRIENDEPVTIGINPSTSTIGKEFLLHGSTQPVNPENVSGSILTTQLTMRTANIAESEKHDVNSDGAITALDVLQVVNYINARNSASSESVAASAVEDSSRNLFDLTGDGVVSAADVLQIVNTINARYVPPASGEGGSLNTAAVDQLMAVDLDLLPGETRDRRAVATVARR